MTSTDGYQVHGEDKEGDIDGFEDAFGNFHMSDRAKVVFPNVRSKKKNRFQKTKQKTHKNQNICEK